MRHSSVKKLAQLITFNKSSMSVLTRKICLGNLFGHFAYLCGADSNIAFLLCKCTAAIVFCTHGLASVESNASSFRVQIMPSPPRVQLVRMLLVMLLE